MIELLVVIGIIVVILSITLGGLGLAKQLGKSAVCASNLRQIGEGMLAYTNNYRGCLFNERDYCEWTDKTTHNQIDPNDTNAYWGVAYAKYGGTTMKAFYCPSAQELCGSPSNSDGTFANGFVYQCYGLNGFGARWCGFSKATRTVYFGNSNYQAALYTEQPGTPAATSPSTVEWIGRSVITVPKPANLVVAQDAYETVLDGNGDTFNAWYQWTPPNHYPDETSEWLRHNTKSNVLFADWHVGQLDQPQQTDLRYYTGLW